MSTVVTRIDQDNFKSFEFDLKKIFVWDNRFASATIKNNSGGDLTMLAGTVLARDSSDDTLVPFDTATTPANGNDSPFAVLAQDLPLIADAGTQANVAFCTSGDVAEEKVLFVGSDTLATVTNLRTVRDQLLSHNIRFVLGEELTISDNF